MLNICGLEPPEATKAVAAFAATIQTAEAWLAACRAIVALLGRYGNKAGPSFLFKAAMKAAEPAGGLHVSDGA